MKSWINRIPKPFRNFYFLTLGLFVVWMLFLDHNDFITQIKLYHKLNSLESQREYYESKISEVEKDREELLSDQDKLEKFAREKYYMRKETEDVYLIVEK